jgi:hypothetical protein
MAKTNQGGNELLQVLLAVIVTFLPIPIKWLEKLEKWASRSDKQDDDDTKK